MTFAELNLMPPLLRAAEELGYAEPSPIQAQAIPPVLAGRDLIGCAQTGTGKTAAFAMPILQRLAQSPAPRGTRSVRALVLTPTRELALQIKQSFDDYGCYLKVRNTVIFGGVGQTPQVEALRAGVDVLVATPGRLNDLCGQGHVDLSRVEWFVLDEADRMLDMGFIHDVTRLLDRMNKRKNLGLFSATISREVMDIAWVYQRDAAEITVREDEQNKPDIKQFRMEVAQNEKADAIARILEETGFDRCMAFCNTKGSTERITKFLQMQGVDAQCIHGDIPQKRREQVMDLFRQGKLQVFVSTDVAARGIDVDDVDIVFNCDVPDENQDYVHRIGRTGRARRQGVAVTFIADYPSKMRIDDIAQKTRNEITPVKFGPDGKLMVVES